MLRIFDIPKQICLFLLCELKQNGKRVVNNIMLLTAWLCQLFEHNTDEQTIIYITKSIEV